MTQKRPNLITNDDTTNSTDNDNIEDTFEDENRDRFGLCPDCQREGICYDVGRSHWFVCEVHLTCWCAGSNLFSGWRSQTQAEKAENIRVLNTCRVVEPYYHPIPKT